MLCTVVDLVLEVMMVLVLEVTVDLVAAEAAVVAAAAVDSEVVVGGVVVDQPSLTTHVVTIKSASAMNVATATLKRQHFIKVITVLV
ncbi:hypothetical protein L0F63_003833 [Massospora cicadina]|nr:hypothetical protein L0F63_003833 [Massospora cicadina]